MNKFLTNFDQNAVTISKKRVHSTVAGKILGFIVVLFLIIAFVYKIVSMINKDTMYLSSFYSNDRSAVNFSDFYFSIVLSD